MDALAKNSTEYVTWYLSLDDNHFMSSYEECLRHFYMLDDLCNLLSSLKDGKTGQELPLAKQYEQKLNLLYGQLTARVGKEGVPSK